MREDRTWKRKEEKKRERARRILYICYFCLICGIILLLGDMGNFSYNRPVIFGSLLLSSTVVWFGRKSSKKNAVFVLIILFCGYFFLQRKMLDKQLHRMLLYLTKMEEGAEDLTLLFSGFSFLLSPVCFFLAFVLNKGWLFYGITLSLLFLGPMFGYYPSWSGLFLLAVFHISDGIYHVVYLKWSDEAEESNTRAVVLEKGILAGILAVLAAFFLACMIPAGNRKAWMKDSVQFVQTWRSTVSDRPLEEPSGKINRGNHYSSGAVQMEVSLSEKPEEGVYLKSFTGGSYRGDAWEPADEADFFPLLNAQKGENAYPLLLTYFDQRQFELIQYGKLEDWKAGKGNSESNFWPGQEYQVWSGIQQIRIQPLHDTQRISVEPYLSFYTSRDSGGGYNFSLFSWEEFEQYQKQLGERHLQWFDQLEEPYREYVNQHYLNVPEERLPRLLTLCQEHPLDDPQEITAFIQQTLGQYAVYSRTPGFMPYGTDIAEYFLFDRQEGYCQHFATAAVLMYRMYGIPARYAAGYRADPENFSLGRDGFYHARLTDRKAHAWVEIYLGGPGWIPIEVTPASGEGSDGEDGADRAAKTDGTDNSGTKNSLFGQDGWFSDGTEEEVDKEAGDRREEKTAEKPLGEPEEGDREKDGNLPEGTDEEEVLKSELDLQDGENRREGYADDGAAGLLMIIGKVLRIAGICAAIILLLFGTVWMEEKLKRKKLERLGADEVYKKMVELLHLGGFLMEFDGTEPDFPKAAANVCRQMRSKSRKGSKDSKGSKPSALPLDGPWSLNRMEEIKAYAFQTAYGRKISSDKERKKVEEEYQQVYALLMKSLRGVKKLKTGVQAAVLVWKK